MNTDEPRFIDLNLRIPLEKKKTEGRKDIFWFDSLSEAPAEVLRHAPHGTVIMPCWSGERPEEARFYSESALAWARLAEPYCSKTQALERESVEPFRYGRRLEDFAEVPRGELRKSDLRPERFPDPALAHGGRVPLNPRFFRGAIQGVASWDGPYRFTRSFEIERSLDFPPGWEGRASLRMRSSCKGPASLRLEWKNLRGPSADVQGSLDVSEKFHERFPWISGIPGEGLRQKLRHWANRTFEVDPVYLKISRGQLGAGILKLKASWEPALDCEVYIEDFYYRIHP